MAKSGRVYLFGSGEYRINPIHGADLAAACYTIIEQGQAYAEVGGPVKYTQNKLAEIAFQSLSKKPKITHLPNWTGVALQSGLETFTSAKTYGPLQFFLSALRMDMVGKSYGTIRLEDHFAELAQKDKQDAG